MNIKLYCNESGLTFINYIFIEFNILHLYWSRILETVGNESRGQDVGLL